MEGRRGRVGPRAPEALRDTGLSRLRARCVARAEAQRAQGRSAARAALAARRQSAETIVRAELMELDGGGLLPGELDPGDLEALVDELEQRLDPAVPLSLLWLDDDAALRAAAEEAAAAEEEEEAAAGAGTRGVACPVCQRGALRAGGAGARLGCGRCGLEGPSPVPGNPAAGLDAAERALGAAWRAHRGGGCAVAPTFIARPDDAQQGPWLVLVCDACATVAPVLPPPPETHSIPQF